MIAYHEVNPDHLSAILTEGLKRTSRGDKGSDSAIIATDKLLDAHRPDELLAVHVSRDDNIYAYYCFDGQVVDITDGSSVAVDDFIAHSTQTVLELQLNADRCFVSNLDDYDALMNALRYGVSDSLVATMVERYWSGLVPLAVYTPGDIARPEIMIPYDLEPSAISVRVK